jgi:hypothetical protein
MEGNIMRVLIIIGMGLQFFVTNGGQKDSLVLTLQRKRIKQMVTLCWINKHYQKTKLPMLPLSVLQKIHQHLQIIDEVTINKIGDTLHEWLPRGNPTADLDLHTHFLEPHTYELRSDSLADLAGKNISTFMISGVLHDGGNK